MDTALIIMAAGMGTRFSGGIKQLAPVGPDGELIIEYSVHDALAAGFNKIVFVIRKDIGQDLRSIVGRRIEKACSRLGAEIRYVVQSVDDVPKSVNIPIKRVNPWGTGQAVLCCRDVVSEPFAVINSDDFYGAHAFSVLHGFLEKYTPDKPNDYAMAGFRLKNTLSGSGGVTRGICKTDENGMLTDVIETWNVRRENGIITSKSGEQDANSLVSMNMWGFAPEFMELLETGFETFLNDLGDEPLKCEFLLPAYISRLLENGRISVRVMETDGRWLGMTYSEDRPYVHSEFMKMAESGIYRRELFSDLI